jgi:hypothetical protein
MVPFPELGLTLSRYKNGEVPRFNPRKPAMNQAESGVRTYCLVVMTDSSAREVEVSQEIS